MIVKTILMKVNKTKVTQKVKKGETVQKKCKKNLVSNIICILEAILTSFVDQFAFTSFIVF